MQSRVVTGKIIHMKFTCVRDHMTGKQLIENWDITDQTKEQIYFFFQLELPEGNRCRQPIFMLYWSRFTVWTKDWTLTEKWNQTGSVKLVNIMKTLWCFIIFGSASVYSRDIYTSINWDPRNPMWVFGFCFVACNFRSCFSEYPQQTWI